MAITITTKRTTAEDQDPIMFPDGVPPFKACAEGAFPGQEKPVEYVEYGGTRDEAAGTLLESLGVLSEDANLPADMRDVDAATLGVMAGSIPGVTIVHD